MGTISNLTHSDIVRAIPNYYTFAVEISRVSKIDVKGPAVGMWAVRNTIPPKHHKGFEDAAANLQIKVVMGNAEKAITRDLIEKAKSGRA